MTRWHRLIMISGVCFALTACNDTLSSVSNKVEHPLPTKVVNRMKAYDMTVQSPIMMRIFKEESVLEVWKAKSSGRYEKIAEYEICKWSGDLGPKHKEGDYQAPEGFYTVNQHQMNPNSSYYLSFNIGYPNRYDRSHGRTGSNLMVHGACSSAGCYSMTDESVLEIYAFAREAFRGGQQAFQVQAFPFRMTAENMARHRDNPNYEFWKMLKVGYDHFEITKTPPKVDVCDRQYVFNQVPQEQDAVFDATAQCPVAAPPPSLQMAYAAYSAEYDEAFSAALSKINGSDSGVFSSLLGSSAEPSAAEAPAPAVLATDARSANPADASDGDAQSAVPSGPATSVEALRDEMSYAPAVVPVPTPGPAPAGVPVAGQNPPPNLYAAAPSAEPTEPQRDKPFWNIWSRN